MTDGEKHIVNFDQINEILNDDSAYLKDFCAAAIESFNSFKKDYSKSMKHKHLHELRKAGHRIKPAAQMIGVDQLITEYERSKDILAGKSADTNIQDSIKRMQKICDAVISDFKQKIDEL